MIFRNHRHNWIPLLFLISGSLSVIWLGVAGKNTEAERILLETRITAEQLKIRLESCFDARANLVETLASYPWQSGDQIVADWTNRTGTLLPLHPGVQALNYVDPGGRIRVVYPVDPNRAALNANLRQNPNPSVVSALSQSQASGEIARTNIIELLQGGKGFALYRPIYTLDGQLGGFVNGVFRVESLMTSCLPEGRLRRDFAFSLFDQDNRFYEQVDPNLNGLSPYQIDLTIDIPGEPWQFSIAPLTSYLRASDTVLGEISFALGLTLILMFTLALRHALLKQRDLERREDEYRLLVENQTDLVVKANPQGEFQYVSPSYCDLFGKTEEEVLGKAFLPLVHEDDREQTTRSLEKLQHAPYTSFHQQRAMTKNGWRWLAWSNRAVLDDDNTIIGVTAVGRDVTDIRRLEERVAHSQKMRAMGELAGGITHDFNNLLQVILGNIEYLLLGDKHDPATQKAMENIRDVGIRAMSLTKKLATLSRQEVTRPEVFDVNAFLRELEDLLAHTLPASVDLAVTLSNAPLPIRGDRAQVEQVLLNLCFNARDAVSSQGHIRLDATQQTVDHRGSGPVPQLPTGDYAVISVADDGHGIAEDVLPRIFDPFFTTKEAGTGTGLGLANSFSIVEQLGGTINVDSTPGSGSRFSVYLPLASSAESVSLSAAPVASVAQSSENKQGRLVLVADDNPQLLELACKVLENAGFETCTAANGEEALELYKERADEIRLLILDLVMPTMGGQDVATAVRALSDEVPILFVSGFVPEEAQKALTEPLIRKPYTIDELMTAVDKLV